jgi:hypothetical protein
MTADSPVVKDSLTPQHTLNMHDNTDTPRTDAARHRLDYFTYSNLSRQLERELTASQAEVERLKDALKDVSASLNKGTEVMSKAEAEIYRLREKLTHAVYLLESYNPTYAATFKAEFQ